MAHYLVELGKVATVIRFDERGYGLSDREVEDFTLQARLADLEAVVDDAGLDRFVLMAMSQGGPVAIAYTAAHPSGSAGCCSTAATPPRCATRHRRTSSSTRPSAR